MSSWTINKYSDSITARSAQRIVTNMANTVNVVTPTLGDLSPFQACLACVLMGSYALPLVDLDRVVIKKK